jgi:hypothetical protein
VRNSWLALGMWAVCVSGIVWAQRAVPSAAGSSVVVVPSLRGSGRSGVCCGHGVKHPFPGMRHGHFGRTPPVFFFSSNFEDYDSYSPTPVIAESPVPLFRRSAEPVSSTPSTNALVQISPGAKLIELPAIGRSAPAILQPTVFLLANGQRMEGRRYTITGDYVYLVIGRRQTARIPIADLDVPATVDANRGNGIELRIPSTASELFLSY